MDNRLPAPSLACGCRSCIDKLHADYSALILANWTSSELDDLTDKANNAVRLQTIGERIDAYTMKQQS